MRNKQAKRIRRTIKAIGVAHEPMINIEVGFHRPDEPSAIMYTYPPGSYRAVYKATKKHLREFIEDGMVRG